MSDNDYGEPTEGELNLLWRRATPREQRVLLQKARQLLDHRARGRWKCRIGLHSWEGYQECFLTDSGFGPDPWKKEVVIAWKQCPRCGNTKLIHILK